MKRVLVPTDFSEEANNASAFAIQYAEKTKAEIHFVHLMTIPIDWVQINDQEKLYPEVTKKVNQARSTLSDWVDKADKAGIKAIDYVHYNESNKAILDYVEDHKIDLIIMGSRGASGFKELLIGSNTERIVRHAKCPVLVVKDKINFSEIKTIMMPSDLSKDQLKVAEKAKEWADICDAELHIVRLNTHYRWVHSQTFIEEIESFASEVGLNHIKARTFDADYVEDGIVQAAEDINCQLIVMGTHKRTGIAHIIAGSITEHVSNHAKRLVLTMPL